MLLSGMMTPCFPVSPFAWQAGDVNVEPFFLDAQAELQSSDRPLLADDGLQGADLRAVAAAHHTGVAGSAQFFDG
jgi:hypothetical protein